MDTHNLTFEPKFHYYLGNNKWQLDLERRRSRYIRELVDVIEESNKIKGEGGLIYTPSVNEVFSNYPVLEKWRK